MYHNGSPKHIKIADDQMISELSLIPSLATKAAFTAKDLLGLRPEAEERKITAKVVASQLMDYVRTDPTFKETLSKYDVKV